jgi:sugar lactone lactonase YvrE
MLSSLTWAGYDVEHAWGEGGHNGKHATAILPDALRWLWRDYPEPIKTPVTPERQTNLLIPGEDWQLVSEGHEFTEGPAVNDQGELFFTDIPKSHIYRVGTNGKLALFAENTGKANGLMFGADGKLYACANEKKQIIAYAPDGGFEVVANNVKSNDLVVGAKATFFTDPANHRIRRLLDDGKVEVVDAWIERPNGIIMSPDESLLYVADTNGQFVYSYQIQTDGSLAYEQPFFHLHIPPGYPNSGADGMTVDTEGRLYVTTRMGLQVCDQPGRVHLIISKPQDAWLSNVTFGGQEFDTLIVTCGDKVYKRKIKATGAKMSEPIKPPKPNL